MKIAFHIQRMNWYRVLSSAIEEALRRGHHVECWHDASARGLQDNIPATSRVPFFISGEPIIREYFDEEWLPERIQGKNVDVVVDCLPPPARTVKKWVEVSDRSRWVLLDAPPTDSIWNIGSEAQLAAIDLFAMQSEKHIQDSIVMMTQDRHELLAYIKKNAAMIGRHWINIVRDRFSFQWGPSHVEYFKKKAIVCGNTALDICSQIDAEAVRHRWDIPKGKKVVALLPCPYGNYTVALPWEKIFMSRSLMHNLRISMAYLFRWGNISNPFNVFLYKNVIKLLKEFCERSDALLVAKLRHSRPADDAVKMYADIILEKESFHPHTALELYKVSALTVGFYSSGAIEAVALDSPYLNIQVPGFPKEFYCKRLLPAYTYCDRRDGVVWDFNHNDFNQITRLSLSSFKLNSDERDAYLLDHLGFFDGRASVRFLDAVEALRV